MTQVKVVDSPFATVKLEVPNIDVPTYIFSSGNASLKKSPQYFDAAEPRRHFSLEEAEVYVKRFAKGLVDLGLRPDDKILLCAPNDLFTPIVLWGAIAAGCVFTGASPTASPFGR